MATSHWQLPLRLITPRLAIPTHLILIQNVGEFSRVEHFTTRLAFNKLDVLLAGDDADLRMFA